MITADGSSLAVVARDQLSLAIGKRGQNVRLAAHVTNSKIDIKAADEFNMDDYEFVGEADEETPTLEVEETISVDEVVEEPVVSESEE